MATSGGTSEQPWLSIVTVVKDDPEGLKLTADSVAQQDLRGVEWIVVDGSANAVKLRDLPESCREAASLVVQAPQGVYEAMNRGLAAAVGYFIIFLNSGDSFSADDVVALLHDPLIESDPVWAFGLVAFEGSTGKLSHEHRFDYERERRRRFRRGRFPLQPATVYRREALVSVGGFDQRLSIAADYKTMLTLSCLTAPLALDRVVTVFQVGGLSTVRWRRSLREAYLARCSVFDVSGPAQVGEWLLSREVWCRTLVRRGVTRIREC